MRDARSSRGDGGGARRRPPRGSRGGGGDAPASVHARFEGVMGVKKFLIRLGMPDSLSRQLGGWLDGLEPGGEAERMEPELSWEGKFVVLGMTAMVDEEDGSVDVEFSGPGTLIEALQADLDEFFRPKQPKGGK